MKMFSIKVNAVKKIQPRGYKLYLVDAVVSVPAEVRVISSVTVDLSAVALLNIL